MAIPDKFCKAGILKPEALTVGEMIKVLQELPEDLEFSGAKIITVYNVGRPSEHVEIEYSDQYE